MHEEQHWQETATDASARKFEKHHNRYMKRHHCYCNALPALRQFMQALVAHKSQKNVSTVSISSDA